MTHMASRIKLHTDKLILPGFDNYKKPRQEFADKLATLDTAGYLKEAKQKIWLSAYANNNPRSDYHWQADTCYDEARRRGDIGLYEKAWRAARASVS